MPAVRLIEIEGKETREITWMGKVIKVIDVMHTARLIEIEGKGTREITKTD